MDTTSGIGSPSITTTNLGQAKRCCQAKVIEGSPPMKMTGPEAQNKNERDLESIAAIARNC
jgi:hypothetical protein